MTMKPFTLCLDRVVPGERTTTGSVIKIPDSFLGEPAFHFRPNHRSNGRGSSVLITEGKHPINYARCNHGYEKMIATDVIEQLSK